MTTHEAATTLIESLPYAPEVEPDERAGVRERLTRRRRDARRADDPQREG